MSNPAPDFDAEKRRRRYAAVLGAAGASTLLIMFIVSVSSETSFSNTKDPFWQSVFILSGVWLVIFGLKYVAAYTFWYRPYASRVRAVLLSLCATFAFYASIYAALVLFVYSADRSFNLGVLIKMFWEFHSAIYGLPYLAAALVGWFFARPAPDAREHF